MLTGGLYGGDTTLFGFGDRYQLFAAGGGFPVADFFGIADVEMVSDKVQERLLANKRSSLTEGIAVACWGGLGDQLKTRGCRASGFAKGCLIAGAYHDSNLVGAGGHRLFHDDCQRCFGLPISVDKLLQWQMSVVTTGGRDHRSLDFHGTESPLKDS